MLEEAIFNTSSVQVSDQVRKAAMAWRINKEQTCAAFSNLSAGITEEEANKREEVIFNARTNWELLRSQTTKHLLSKYSSSLKGILHPMFYDLFKALKI